MSRVVAAVDNSAAAGPVLATASALAPVLGATVDAVHVANGEARTASATARRLGVPLRTLGGAPYEALAALATENDVVALVVGARGRPSGRRPAGHLALALADTLTKPVVVVPPEARPPEHLHRVLVAMEGTPAKARSLKRAIDLAAGADLDLVVVHVDDESSIPSFSDQVQHETEAYAQEFLARYAHAAPEARLLLRVGVPADEIIGAAASVDAELLALGWPQSASPERGEVARRVLERSPVPVLLVALA